MVHQVKDKDDFVTKMTDAGGKLVVVDFFAVWCGPCKVIAPKIEEMSNEFNEVVFLKLDVDECEDVAQDYDIKCMPTFLFFKNGEKVDEFAGANEAKIRELVCKLK